ncbi:hypothetical protein BDP67DRAFT_15419 [Colletotrichum lupini]|nr:hypothetical protein BDP67DRAFT_15419 [Colletotrichum lupini]
MPVIGLAAFLIPRSSFSQLLSPPRPHWQEALGSAWLLPLTGLVVSSLESRLSIINNTMQSSAPLPPDYNPRQHQATASCSIFHYEILTPEKSIKETTGDRAHCFFLRPRHPSPLSPRGHVTELAPGWFPLHGPLGRHPAHSPT